MPAWTMVKNGSCVTIWVMKKSRSPLIHLPNSAATELPFFILLTVVLLGISVYSVYISPGLKNPARLLAFCALMLAHIGLYWLVFLRDLGLRLTLAYLFAQGLLA